MPIAARLDHVCSIGKPEAHDNERVGQGQSGVLRFPVLEQFQQCLRLVGRGRLPGLILIVDAVAGGADANFTRLKRDPVPFAHDRRALCIG